MRGLGLDPGTDSCSCSCCDVSMLAILLDLAPLAPLSRTDRQVALLKATDTSHRCLHSSDRRHVLGRQRPVVAEKRRPPRRPCTTMPSGAISIERPPLGYPSLNLPSVECSVPVFAGSEFACSASLATSSSLAAQGQHLPQEPRVVQALWYGRHRGVHHAGTIPEFDGIQTRLKYSSSM